MTPVRQALTLFGALALAAAAIFVIARRRPASAKQRSR
jgi:hypothetical protein